MTGNLFAAASNILINLPERTYANDCIVVNLEEKDFIEIKDY